MRLTFATLFVALAMAGGCSSTPAEGVVSIDGGSDAAAIERTAEKSPSVPSQAYANFAVAVRFHVKSDTLFRRARGMAVDDKDFTEEERKKFRTESEELWRKAVIRYHQTLAFDPKSVAVCDRLSRGYFDRGQDLQGMMWLKRAVALDGRNFMLLCRLAVRYERAGKVHEAIKTFRQAEKSPLDDEKKHLLPSIILEIARLHQMGRRFQQAALAYERFLALDDSIGGRESDEEFRGRRGRVHRQLGKLYTVLKKPHLAARAFKKASELQPGNKKDFLRLAGSYNDAGEHDQAVNTCLDYILKNPKDTAGMRMMVTICRGRADYTLVVARVKKILAEKPHFYQLHYLVGALHEDAGETDVALEEYRKIQTARKPFRLAYERIVEIEARRRNYDRVLAALAAAFSAEIREDFVQSGLRRYLARAAAVEDMPARLAKIVTQKQHAGFLYVMGRLHQAQKNNPEAMQAYREVVKLKPAFTDAGIRLANLYLVEKKPTEAVKVLGPVAALNTDSVFIWRLLAEAQAAAGDVPAAVKTMKHVVKLNPADALSTVHLAGLILDSGKVEDAAGYLEQGLKNHPEDRQRWLFIVSNFYVQTGFKVDRALQLLEEADRTRPDNYEVKRTLGWAFLTKKDYARARKHLTDAVKLNPRALETRVLLSQSFEFDGKSVEAEKELRDALRLNPDNGAMTVELGRFLVRSRRGIDEGIDLLKKAVDADPKNPGSRLALGSACLRTKRFPEAARIFESLIDDYPENSLVRSQLAMVYDEMDEVDKAEKELLRILKDNPDDVNAANNLGYMYAERSMKLPEARELLESVLEREPDNGTYLDSMGWICYKQGDLKKALEYLKKADLAEEDAVISEHLGDVYFRLGKQELALSSYEKAAKTNPESETASTKVKLLKAGKDPFADAK